MVDLAGNGSPLVVDIGGGKRASPEGVGYSSEAIGGSASTQGAFPSAWQLTNQGTIFWRGSATGSVTSGSGYPIDLLGVELKPGVVGLNPAGYAYMVGLDPTLGGLVFSYTTSSGAQIEVGSTVATSSIVGTGPFTMAASFVVNGAINFYIWYGSAAHPPKETLATASATWSGGAPSYGAGIPLSIGVTPSLDSADASQTITTSAYLFNRALTASQIARLNVAPFDFLRPVARRVRINNQIVRTARRWNRTYLVR
jgi:hypothetical protein